FHEVAPRRFEAMVLQQPYHLHLRSVYHHALLVEHQHVQADPLADYREMEVPQPAYGIGLRRDEDVPRLEDRRKLPRIDVFRVDEHLPRGERDERRIDVQWLRAVTRDLMNGEVGSQVTPQPCDA